MEKYTAGQLAALAGVSARTVRYYDTRGLLRPSGYSEGGYRLYDETALLKMQQIMMLKFAGFSLEETQGILLMGQDMELRDILEDQRQLLTQKKDQLEEIILLLDNVLSQEQIRDTACLTESMQHIRRVNHSGRTYQFCEAHGQRPLYPWEFDQLRLKPQMKVLDVGCGFGMIWRHSWQRIPEGTDITMLDSYSGTLSHFGAFLEENQEKLQLGVRFQSRLEDAEKAELAGGYDRILMAYLLHHLKEPEKLLERCREALPPEGEVLVVDGTGEIIQGMDDIFHAYSGEYCLTARREKAQAEEDAEYALLKKHFPVVERVPFDNTLEFTHPLELYRFLMDSYQDLTQAIRQQGIGFVNFLRRYVEEHGTVTLHSRVMLYRCRKEADR
jgi:DNA-binding transcriptional MerR regulator/ubiquinone/menaquinone biosynthesis C-methylase UbiE